MATTLRRGTQRQGDAGFGLMELLLAMSLGLLLCGVVVQALLGEGRTAQHFTRLLRERGHQRRALALIRADLEGATAVVNEATPLPVSCGTSGRRVVLQMQRQGSVITYSVGAAPSSIWRGQVLVRCGQAYGLDGRIDPASTPVSRVVVDGLASDPSSWTGCGRLPGATALNGSTALPFSACLDPTSQLVALRLEQSFADGAGPVQRVRSEAVAGAG